MPDTMPRSAAHTYTASAASIARAANAAGTMPTLDDLAELKPDWAIPGVRAFVTGRRGGVSSGQWGLAGGLPGGLNLGARCGDDPQAVLANRQRLRACLPAEPRWLRQVHGAAVHRAEHGPGTDELGADASGADASGVDPSGADAPGVDTPGVDTPGAAEPVADAAITDQPGVVLAVLTADCLPVFFADAQGRAVGVAHAGWRGLAAGVLEATAQALRECLRDDAAIHAWLGPAIGPASFEVGDDVRHAFCDQDAVSAQAFTPGERPGKWLADLYWLARRRLAHAGVAQVSGGGHCTVREPERFYSFRRDAGSGRMASLIWLQD